MYLPAHLGWSKDQILLCIKCDFWAHKCVQVYLRSEIVSWDCFVSNAPSCLSVSVNRSCLAVAVLMITCAVPLSTRCLVSSDGVIVNTSHLAVSLSAYYYCVVLLCCYCHCVNVSYRTGGGPLWCVTSEHVYSYRCNRAHWTHTINWLQSCDCLLYTQERGHP